MRFFNTQKPLRLRKVRKAPLAQKGKIGRAVRAELHGQPNVIGFARVVVREQGKLFVRHDLFAVL